jgi:CDP-diacylglycerol--serine O-phosphatidyltransferase
MTVHRRRQYLYLLPNAVTGLSMFLGLLAIMTTIDGRPNALELAAWWIIVACLMDGLDGAVARFTRTSSNFGVQFDSLSDLVTFGVAPAVILYGQISRWNMMAATGVATAHVIAGAARLARYNISATPDTKKKAFQGLPIPAAAGMVVALVLCLPRLEPLLGADPTRRLLPSLSLVVSYLMISKIRFATFRDLVFPIEETPIAVAVRILAFAVFIVWLLFLPEERAFLALAVFGGYVLYSITAALAWRWRLIRHAHQEEAHRARRGAR